MGKSIRLKNNDYLVNDWASLIMAGRKTLNPTAWQEMTFPFVVGTDHFSTNNNNMFEFVTNGVKCNFKGAVIMIMELSLESSVQEYEFDLIDYYGTFYQVRGTVKRLISIIPVNKNTIINLKYITGISSFEVYNARLQIQRIA